MTSTGVWISVEAARKLANDAIANIIATREVEKQEAIQPYLTDRYVFFGLIRRPAMTEDEAVRKIKNDSMLGILDWESTGWGAQRLAKSILTLADNASKGDPRVFVSADDMCVIVSWAKD